MLTLRTILKVTRQANSYGDVRTGALDHLPSRLTGHRTSNSSSRSPNTQRDATEKGYVRKWDEGKGVYVYVED